METIRKIRLALSKGMSIREASRKFNKSRKTIRKIIRTEATSFSYHRKKEHYPALEGYREALEALLEAETEMPVPTAPAMMATAAIVPAILAIESQS